MREIAVATAQFEARDGDKRYNLAVMEDLSRQAASRGAELIVFHECSIPGYTYLETLGREEMFAVAEPVPVSDSLRQLQDVARRLKITIGAGLVERDGDDLYNCYALVGPEGVLGKHRKLHAFVSPYLSCGGSYTVLDALGCRIGILICYDNNLPENPRLTAMLGAEIILMPHVTGCLPSPAPGRGVVPLELWHNREKDPVPCRLEFDGPKGRGWLMKWLPARAWENGVYVVYANVIGLDGGTLKPGGSLILDPFGEVVIECRTLANEVVVARLQPENLARASGASYIKARRPELYGKMLEDNPALGPDRRPEIYWQKIRKQI